MSRQTPKKERIATLAFFSGEIDFSSGSLPDSGRNRVVVRGIICHNPFFPASYRLYPPLGTASARSFRPCRRRRAGSSQEAFPDAFV